MKRTYLENSQRRKRTTTDQNNGKIVKMEDIKEDSSLTGWSEEQGRTNETEVIIKDTTRENFAGGRTKSKRTTKLRLYISKACCIFGKIS